MQDREINGPELDGKERSPETERVMDDVRDQMKIEYSTFINILSQSSESQSSTFHNFANNDEFLSLYDARHQTGSLARSQKLHGLEIKIGLRVDSLGGKDLPRLTYAFRYSPESEVSGLSRNWTELQLPFEVLQGTDSNRYGFTEIQKRITMQIQFALRMVSDRPKLESSLLSIKDNARKQLYLFDGAWYRCDFDVPPASSLSEPFLPIFVWHKLDSQTGEWRKAVSTVSQSEKLAAEAEKFLQAVEEWIRQSGLNDVDRLKLNVIVDGLWKRNASLTEREKNLITRIEALLKSATSKEEELPPPESFITDLDNTAKKFSASAELELPDLRMRRELLLQRAQELLIKVFGRDRVNWVMKQADNIRRRVRRPEVERQLTTQQNFAELQNLQKNKATREEEFQDDPDSDGNETPPQPQSQVLSPRVVEVPVEGDDEGAAQPGEQGDSSDEPDVSDLF